MSNLTLNLDQFIKPVPICEHKSTLETLRHRMQTTASKCIVVLSQEQFPLGIISLNHLLPHLLNQASAPLNLSSLTEPVSVCYVDTSIEDLAQLLVVSNSQDCALIDAKGKFLGLLDSGRLLKNILPQLRNQQTKVVAPSQPSTEQPKPPVPPSSTPLFLSSVAYNSLLQLLDKFPLPLRLESNSGQVIRQNSGWLSQVKGKTKTGQSLTSNAREWEQKVPSLASLLPEATPGDLGYHQSSSRVTRKIKPFCQIQTTSIATEFRLQQLSHLPFLAKNPNSTTPTNTVPQDRSWHLTRIPLRVANSTIANSTLTLNSQIQIEPESSSQETSLVWLTLAMDITEQEQLCKELAAKNADLVQLNRLKDEFLSCISHELKSPLTAVVGLSSLLKEQSLGKLNQRQERYAGLIYQSGHHLMTLVNDILDLTRLETGQLQLNPELLQIRSVSQSAYEQVLQLQSWKEQNQEQEQPLKSFTLEIEPGLETLIADELRLRQMLVHLLDNALKFTQVGGEVGLKVNRWEGWIAFTVWDTGIGIPESAQHLIFQKFQQLENPLTRRFEGTGLGLVLTQRLARAHGGDISFISKVGEGSQFTLLLPPSPPGRDALPERATRYSEEMIPEEQCPPPIQPPLVKNRLVLIVEAVPVYIENLKEYLRELGYRVVIARSGTEALEKARCLRPCCILLNPLLPLLSGWDVLILLKADEKTKTIPIFVTATRGEKQRAHNNGADDFLTLPVVKEDLQASLKNIGEPLFVPRKKLVILRLNPQINSEITAFDLALASYSAELDYRFIEANDLEQAGVLVQLWHPQVILLDTIDFPEPETYLRQISKQPSLAALPIVTLGTEITELANQVDTLSIFPCLVPHYEQNIAALIEVIQVAAGMVTQPYVLTFGGSRQNSQGQEWLKAVTQYLQTAGLRSSLSHSWQEVYSQIQYQSTSLLLLYVEDAAEHLQLTRELERLAKVETKPPILVLDHRSHPQIDSISSQGQLEQLLQQIATKIVPVHNQSMNDLLTQITQLIS